MQFSNQRTGVDGLLSRGWKLYGESLGSTFPLVFLFDTLPSLLMTAVSYYGLVTAFHPFFQVLQTILQSLLRYGFDEWAIGQAVERLLTSMEGYSMELILRQMLGALGWMVVLMLILMPIRLVLRYVVLPMAAGAAAEAQSRVWQGIPVTLRSALVAVKGRAGRLIVLNLVYLLACGVIFMLLSVGLATLLSVPFIGTAAAICVAMCVMVLFTGLREVMVLIAINEDQWHFHALTQAFRRYFTDYAYGASSAVIWLCILAVALICAVLDLMLMFLLTFPPVMTPMQYAFALPLSAAVTTSVYYDQRKREGYAPECAVR